MRSMLARVAICAALLGVLGAVVMACAPVGSSGRSVSAQRIAPILPVAHTQVRTPAPVVAPRGVGHETFDLGHGVRVYAFWRPGEQDVPWAINVHGGSWRYGTGASAGFVAWARHERARGWAAFTVDYRLVPKVSWPAPEVDVERAIEWVRRHAQTFGLDLPHGFVIGHSAGGQLASIAALRLGGFAGAVSISGAVDPYYIYRYAGDRALRHDAALLVDSRVRNRSLWSSTVAETYLGRHVLPFLVMHSADDPIVPITVARTFAEDLRLHGYPATFVQVPGRDHSLSSSADNRVVDEWMDSVLDRSAA